MQQIVNYHCKNLKNGNISNHVENIMKQVAQQLSINEDDTLFYNIRLAIWEIFCNIVVHSHKNNEKEVIVDIAIDEQNKIKVQIKDFGEGFNWENEISKEMPAFVQIGGRGLLFIEQVSKEFYFDSLGRKATIIFEYE